MLDYEMSKLKWLYIIQAYPIHLLNKQWVVGIFEKYEDAELGLSRLDKTKYENPSIHEYPLNILF